jgi:hypothetical protein
MTASAAVRRGARALLLVVLAVAAHATPAAGPRPRDAPPAPVEAAARDALDPWIGEWDVFVGSDRVGVDRVEKALGGNVVLEHWTDVRGGEGESFFYFVAAKALWKQVWAQPDGVVKEKLSTATPGGIRFEGRTMLPDGREHPDRTTLTWLAPGRVRQLIEVSRDGGATWTATFDATYVRRSQPPRQ